MGSNERGSTALPYFALGLGLGMAAGVLAGLLLAPKPGKETREELLEKAKKAAGDLKNRLEDAAARAEEAREAEEGQEIPEVSEGGL